MPRSGRDTSHCYGPDLKAWPGRPHQGPWATTNEIEQWREWRINRATLDSRVPREYVLDGRMIHEDGDFGRATSVALEGPITVTAKRSAYERRLNLDGFADWLSAAWPPDAVLIWRHHDESRSMTRAFGPSQGKPVFEVILEILEQCDVQYRLE